ncbi:MAG: signal peptide peptidase SppA [Pirellulales bacterium]|nr:signal peptide peptidase SppA [Pirellulales bacterium]
MAQDPPISPMRSNPVEPQIVSPIPQRIVLEQRAPYFGRFGKLAAIGFVISIFVIFGLIGKYHSYFNPSNGPQEKYHSLSKTATSKVVILDIQGTILETDGYIKKQIDRVREDEDVVAVVLRIDSPGGTVDASDYLYYHLNRLRQDRKIPMVVSMGGLCASGGYYIAMAVGDQKNSIFAEPSTWTGSIGVVIPHYDLSGLLARFDVKDDSITSHPYKLMGSPTRKLTEEEKAKEQELLQDLVDRSFERFKEVVQSGRPGFKNHPDVLELTATGQVFSSGQALELGLIDRIGFVEDAINRAIELAHKRPQEVRCVQYKKPPGALDALLGMNLQDLHPGQSRLSLAQLFDLAAPRAYYLWTTTPARLAGRNP